jgi:DNA polymerase-3 subunit epsilon
MKKERLPRPKNSLNLTKLAVLVLDCQATHSNPTTGHLVEIGWVKMQATLPFDHEMITKNVQTHLVKIREHVPMPKHFLRMTGIKSEERNEAISKRDIWQRLHRAAKKTSSENQGICPTVIHFRRYEEPYLQQLCQEFAPNEEFPFTIVCTHEIALRLYPGLPRKSLRAVAGYFGFSLSDLRRSLHHVVATAFIWHHMVPLLKKQENISSLIELQDWLNNPPAPTVSRLYAREYPMEKTLRQDLPHKPGIYRMYRSTGDLLYIGKAKSLKHRINSYFHKRGRHAEHILEMLSQAQKLSTTETQTAMEAAVRESDEIKLLSPPYNRALQPNERHLLFYSKDLQSKNTEPHRHHPVGPFPSNINMESLSKLTDVLNGKIRKFTPQLMELVLATPAEYAPDKECFKLGLEAFRDEYCFAIEAPINLGHVLKWGAQFWEEKLAEKEAEQDREESEESQEEEEQEKIEEGWTQERVFKALRRVIRLGSFQMRRARWFCRLSESTIRWTIAGEKKGRTHYVVIKNGSPNFESHTTSPENISIPPGHKSTLLDRQKCFDIFVYDRMRIITTEMRRIIRENRDIELCLHPGHILDYKQLKKMLKWV